MGGGWLEGRVGTVKKTSHLLSWQRGCWATYRGNIPDRFYEKEAQTEEFIAAPSHFLVCQWRMSTEPRGRGK